MSTIMSIHERLEYLQHQYTTDYSDLRKVSSPIFQQLYDPTDRDDREERDFAEYWAYEYLKRLYNIICTYFETLQLHNYLSEFKKKFDPIVQDSKKAIGIISVPFKYGDYDEDFSLLIHWESFLAPFEIGSKKSTEAQTKRIIEFIESTPEILKLTHTVVKSESDINNMVREVARLFYYEVSAYSAGYFTHPFTSYRPDIIIKELSTAIEYKLIRKDSEVSLKLDELIIDAKRYTGNPFNKQCIAAFCLSNKVKKTKKVIREEWIRLNFPDNWKLVILSDIKIEV